MPTFDFLCTACDNVFEFQRPFGSDTIPKCPACGSKKTEKQIAPPVIQFKGSGFYKTDSAKNTKPIEHTKPKDPPKPAESPKPADSAATKKEDSKPK